MSEIGHNVEPNLSDLKGIVGQIVGLEEKRSEIVDQIKDVYAEAKDGGFNPAIVRKIVGEMLDPAKLDKHITDELITDTYRQHVKLIGDNADPHRAKLEAIAASLQKMGVSVHLGAK